MWLPEIDEIIWKLDNETMPIRPVKEFIFNSLNKNIDINEWHKKYANLYSDYLNNDAQDIYDVTNEINYSIIKAIKKTNNLLRKSNIILFYWFDVDRVSKENWRWISDPLNGKDLLKLDGSFHEVNRKVSLDNYMVFPD